MREVNIQEAKAQLSRLVDRAAEGEGFIITKAGRPLVKVVPLNPPGNEAGCRLGFLAGEIAVPDDFDSMGDVEIGRLFGQHR